MSIRPVSAVLFLLVLGGCGLGDLFTSDSEDMHVRALVRDELDRHEAEAGPKRRGYIDSRVQESIDARDTGTKRIAALESKLGKLTTDLNVMSRRFERRVDLGASAIKSEKNSGSSEAPKNDELADLRTDVDAALRAVSKLNADVEAGEARQNARFERLELRTREVAWPESDTLEGLHLASYRSHEAAEAGWRALQAEYPDLLGNEEPSYIEVDTVAGLFVRLMVGAGADRDWLEAARDLIRGSGEYAMIMPIPVRGSAPDSDGMDIPAAPKSLVPGS